MWFFLWVLQLSSHLELFATKTVSQACEVYCTPVLSTFRRTSWLANFALLNKKNNSYNIGTLSPSMEQSKCNLCGRNQLWDTNFFNIILPSAENLSHLLISMEYPTTEKLLNFPYFTISTNHFPEIIATVWYCCLDLQKEFGLHSYEISRSS